MTSSFIPFDLTGALPTGLTALEASAGTGKTYTLSALAVRFVAEAGVAVNGLCVVSFTEAVTAELRGRIRQRFVEAVDHLSIPGATTSDPLLHHLAATCANDGDRLTRLGRLQQAVAEFDAATISTIHGFCRRVLASGGGTADRTIAGGDHDVAEVVNDLVLARVAHDPECLVRPDRLATAVRTSLAMADARLFRPADPTGQITDDERARRQYTEVANELIEEAVAEVRRRREARRCRTFDELLSDTRRQLLDPQHGPALIDALGDRYQAVLVDEFQDTDRVQWDIFRTAFGHPGYGGSVVLVGDPKQSIYRFRSADISAYLDAKGAASSTAGLDVNWRSDGPLLQALETLFTGQDFGSPGVTFHPVRASEGRTENALRGAGPAPFQVRLLTRTDGTDFPTSVARRAVRADVVGTTASLLSGGVTITVAAGPDGPIERPLRPRDIAILTYSNPDANTLALELAAAGIPAATASASSVLDTEAAHQWSLLLRALERPHHAGSARAAALTWFVGHDASTVGAYDDERLAALHDQLGQWADLASTSGLPRVLQQARTAGLHLRLLATPGGERHLTDVEHVAELLHSATAGRPVGASGLLAALDDLSGTARDDETSREAVMRRIDRDDDAVQVLTIHRAKGLEFPVVLCPFLWTQTRGPSSIYHARQDDGHRYLDTSWVAEAPPRAWNKPLRLLAAAEQQGEASRLVYVALTRARHRCITWWATPTTTKGGAPSAYGAALVRSAGLTTPPTAVSQLDPLVEASNGTIEVVAMPTQVATQRTPRTPSDLPLTAANADRRLERHWRIWSFSAISAAAAALLEARPFPPPFADASAAPLVGGHDEAAPDGAPDVDGGVDEGVDGGVDGGVDTLSNALPRFVSWHDTPAGARFGTLVHRVFERCDFASPTLRDDLVEQCARELAHQRLAITPETLADALADTIHAPLGGPVGQLRLRDIERADRLDELDFLLPLGRARADQIGSVLAEHLPADDPLRAWAEGMAHHGFTLDVEGLLTGSIDLVTRTTDDHGHTRYWVADYKSNRLPGGASSSGGAPYDRAHLAEAMIHSNYGLQAALYLVALHRYLRWRVPGYEPDRHLGGAAYLFVRGMDPSRSADDARGVFWWTPPVAAVTALDDLLALGASAA